MTAIFRFARIAFIAMVAALLSPMAAVAVPSVVTATPVPPKIPMPANPSSVAVSYYLANDGSETVHVTWAQIQNGWLNYCTSYVILPGMSGPSAKRWPRPKRPWSRRSPRLQRKCPKS
jgi:hypothetical protein